MNREEAVKAYMERFGGFPFMMTRGIPEQKLIELVEDALRCNQQMIIPSDPDCDY